MKTLLINNQYNDRASKILLLRTDRGIKLIDIDYNSKE
jgi:hypothetical protein